MDEAQSTDQRVTRHTLACKRHVRPGAAARGNRSARLAKITASISQLLGADMFWSRVLQDDARIS